MNAGKVWKFGDNINTDLMLPGPMLYVSDEEQKNAVFAANRPGWAQIVQSGEILVGGRNFGMGSSRPAARSLRNLKLACLLADSINGLFFRNAVNFGFVALECPGVHAAFEEGETAQVSIEDWAVVNVERGARLAIKPVPKQLLDLMTNGGVFPFLERSGLIAPVA